MKHGLDHRFAEPSKKDRGDDQYRFNDPESMTSLYIDPCSIRVNPWLKTLRKAQRIGEANGPGDPFYEMRYFFSVVAAAGGTPSPF